MFCYQFFSVCPAGSFLNAENGDVCDICPVNTYNNGNNSNSCEQCPLGTYTDGETGQTSPTSCGGLNHILIVELRFLVTYFNSSPFSRSHSSLN